MKIYMVTLKNHYSKQRSINIEDNEGDQDFVRNIIESKGEVGANKCFNRPREKISSFNGVFIKSLS